MPMIERELVAASPELVPTIATVVCIPAFRRPQHLRLTLDSLVAQRTDRRFAVVVVDNDARERGSARVVAEYLRAGK